MADKRNPPSPNLGMPVFVYQDGAADPVFGFVTREYTADDFEHPKDIASHRGYIDAHVFPSGQGGRPALSIAPKDYTFPGAFDGAAEPLAAK